MVHHGYYFQRPTQNHNNNHNTNTDNSVCCRMYEISHVKIGKQIVFKFILFTCLELSQISLPEELSKLCCRIYFSLWEFWCICVQWGSWVELQEFWFCVQSRPVGDGGSKKMVSWCFFYPGKIVQLAIKSFFEAGKCNVFHIVVFPCVKFLKSKSV